MSNSLEVERALRELDPNRLRAIADRLPKEQGQQVRQLAESLSNPPSDPAELKSLSDLAQGLLPFLLGQLEGLTGPLDAVFPKALPEGFMRQLQELEAGLPPGPSRESLQRARVAAEGLQSAIGGLESAVLALQQDSIQAVRSAQSMQPGQRVDASALQQAQAQITEATATLASEIGEAARHAALAKLPQSHGLAEAWLGLVQQLPAEQADPLRASAMDLAFQGAIVVGHLARAEELAVPLTGQAMERKDWQRAAVYQHHLADLAQAQGALDLLVRARSKEALLLVRVPKYRDTARLMTRDLRNRCGSAPVQVQARMLLHVGDVHHGLGDGSAAAACWVELLELPDVEALAPIFVARAHASLGFEHLANRRHHPASKHLEAARDMALAQGNLDVWSAAVEGLLESLMAQGQTEQAQALSVQSRRVALDQGGPEAAAGMLKIADLLGVPR